MAPAASVSIPHAYREFAFGTGMRFGGWGMPEVLFAWLVAGELWAREELVGFAQLVLILPALLLTLWGVCGAVFVSTGPSVSQEMASEARRASVLSADMLDVAGAGTLGSPWGGLLAGQLGALATFRSRGSAMLAFLTLACFPTDVWVHE